MNYQTLNPTTGKVEKTFKTHTDAELKTFLNKAHEAYKKMWAPLSFEERKVILLKAAQLLRHQREAHARLITVEMGKIFSESLAEIEVSASILEYFAKHAQKFLAPIPMPSSIGKAHIVYQPLGIVYCIEPWNFPYYQLSRVVGPNLMAGNVVMAKHASNVPQCAQAFETLFKEAGAPEGVYTNLFITNEQSEQLIGEPAVQAVALTGSEKAGRIIASQAGKALKQSTLELGGSDPLIILADADLDKAVQAALQGRTRNNGQVCTASKRMIIDESLVEVFTARLKEAFENLQAGDPFDPQNTQGPMSSEKALHLALSQIDDAMKGGAQLITGGQRMDREGFFIKPAILTHITANNPVHYQEIFAPVALIYSAKNEQEAIQIANDSPYGLSASIFTADEAHGYEIAKQIESGMVFVNQLTKGVPELPFGGIKNSGYGRELSHLGIQEFTNKKLICCASSLPA